MDFAKPRNCEAATFSCDSADRVQNALVPFLRSVEAPDVGDVQGGRENTPPDDWLRLVTCLVRRFGRASSDNR